MRCVLSTCTSLALDGLVLLGGTFTNTDAAHLAEFLAGEGCKTCVVGVPCTIDGDMRGPALCTTLGFDTACKITAGLMGNLETDCLSAKKYLYFVRVLGKEQGHMALEVALQSRPNILVLGEDCAERSLTLMDVVREIADTVCARFAAGKNFAVCLLSEGLPNYIPELKNLLREIDSAFQAGFTDPSSVIASLTPWSKAVLDFLPSAVQSQLFLERESNGRAQLSQISTERLLLELVNGELQRRKAAGLSKAKGGNGMGFFFGYQARSAMPTNFDCSLGSVLGHTAASLVASGFTGYLASCSGCGGGVDGAGTDWSPLGIPLTSLLTLPLAGESSPPAQTRTITPSNSSGNLQSSSTSPVSGSAAFSFAPSPSSSSSSSSPHLPQLRPTIRSVPVDIRGPAFRTYRASAGNWAEGDLYCNPGPVQFFGLVANQALMTLEAEAIVNAK